ncbi:CapA family protein [bacterium]|nr:CapA family protein [bacterium]
MDAGTVTLAFMGDVMLGRGVNEALRGLPPEAPWGTVLPCLQRADAAIANLECALTDHAAPWARTPKVFHFRAEPWAAQVLKAANIRCVNLANNHSLDFEERGLLDTLRSLDAEGIAHAGAGRNEQEARTPALFEAKGLSVAVIGMTDNEPAFAAGPEHPGTQYLPIGTDSATLARIEGVVRAARAQGADLVVLSLHWGPNMVTEPPAHFRAFAHAALACGVDVLHGHSAHLFQAVERHGDGLILYDAGDFLDDYVVDPSLRNDWSFLFLLELRGTSLHRLRMLPVRLRFARVDLAEGTEFEAIRTRMESRCRPFETALRETPEGLELSMASEGRGAP